MRKISYRQPSVQSAIERSTENPKYELEEVNLSASKENQIQELKLNKITTYSFKINNLPRSPSHIPTPSSNSKAKLPPIASSLNIYDFNLFRPQILTEKAKHSSKAFSISSPKSPLNLYDQKASPKIVYDITVDSDDPVMNSPSPTASRRHDSLVNLFIGPKRLENSIQQSATFRDDKNLAFKTIHATQNIVPKKLVSTLVKRKEQLEGFIISKVYKWPDNRVTLNECMKPVVKSGTKKFVKKIVKNFKPAEQSPKKLSQRSSAAPLANPGVNIDQDVLGESNEVTKL